MNNKTNTPSEQQNNDPKTEECVAIEGVLEEVAETNPKAAEKLKQIFIQKVSHQGPMPSAKEVEHYAKTQADLPERMMKMAETSQDNKAKHNSQILDLKQQELNLEKLNLETTYKAHLSGISYQKLSLGLAFLVVNICIIGSFYLAMNDKTAVASIIGGVTLIGVVGAFLKHKPPKSESADTA